MGRMDACKEAGEERTDGRVLRKKEKERMGARVRTWRQGWQKRSWFNIIYIHIELCLCVATGENNTVFVVDRPGRRRCARITLTSIVVICNGLVVALPP
jgi:hypothetical protein